MLQTILIPKSKFTYNEAIKFLEDHNYSHRKVDETDHFYRFRQSPPGFKRYYTKTLKSGVELVYGII